MKLCLGTVQFGMNYGIKKHPKPSYHDVMSMLDYATQNGIYAIDTARAYGDAEKLVGIFLEKRTIAREKLFLSSKMLPNTLDDVPEKNIESTILKNLTEQLKTLKTDYLDTYLFHTSAYAFKSNYIEALYNIKKKGLINHIGVSVYFPDEAKACIASKYVDFIQLPSSILDQRMDREGVFSQLDSLPKIVHSRSAFVQGLITMEEQNIPENHQISIPVIKKFNTVCQKYHLKKIELALLYVKKFKQISHLVFGVDSLQELKEDLLYFNNNDLNDSLFFEIKDEFNNLDANIYMPSLWVKK